MSQGRPATGIWAQFSVRAASHVHIAVRADASADAEIVIKHLGQGNVLAIERRGLPAGTDSVFIKTPPGATHVACSFEVRGEPQSSARFVVESGAEITPICRHLVVIGAMKAGTTTLFRSLEQHPAICRTRALVPELGTSKEINYFRNQYRKGHTPLHYDWRFPFDPEQHKWTLDVSPNYAKLWKSRGVPSRIATIGGETKLIYILREPVDRIESHIAHALADHGKIRNLQHCVRVSQYALHLDGFARHFRREQILLLDFQRLRDDPRSTLDEVYDFLDIDHVEIKPRVHNRRRVKFRLTEAERSEYADSVRPDVERLIDEYGFEPARGWLRLRVPWWRRSLPTRK